MYIINSMILQGKGSGSSFYIMIIYIYNHNINYKLEVRKLEKGVKDFQKF
jgi:uncharacterized membrane-anchored protein